MRWYSELIPHMYQSSSRMGRKKLLTKKEPLNPLFLKSLSLKNECLGPFSLTLTINYRSYPGDFIWFHAAPEHLLGCTLLIKELWGVKHRVGLSSPLQPNQSDSALPHTAPPPTPLLNTEHIENIFNLPIQCCRTMYLSASLVNYFLCEPSQAEDVINWGPPVYDL